MCYKHTKTSASTKTGSLTIFQFDDTIYQPVLIASYMQMFISATSQIAFHRRSDVGCRRWANGFLTDGPTLAQRRQATGENYILCIASANQMMFIDNFCTAQPMKFVTPVKFVTCIL